MSLTHHPNPGRMLRRLAYLAAAAVLVLPGLASSQEASSKDETYGLKTNVAITGLASFDISWVDASLSKYFLADRSNKSVDVLNTGSAPNLATQIIPPGVFAFAGFTGNNDTSGPNGLLTLKNTGGSEIWVGDGPTLQSTATTGANCATDAFGTTTALLGTCSTVKVFAASATGGATPTHVIPTNGKARADELCFNPVDHQVLMANDADSPPFVSFISTNSYTVQKQLAIPEATNGIEQCQWSPRTGMYYLNIPEVNGPGDDSKPGAVYVINPKTMTVVNKFTIPLSACAGPQGMAIGPDEQILLGCHAGNSAVINENSGQVTHVLTGLAGSDEVWFNSGDGHYFLALGNNPNGHELGIVDSRGARPDQTIGPIVSKASPHSVAADPTTNFAYLPLSGGINIYAPSGRDDHSAFINRHGNDD
jgi:hypothetical protein